MVAAVNVHNTRILRFLLILLVVILTIFIYASYSTASTTLTPLAHMRGAPTAAQLQQQQLQQSPIAPPPDAHNITNRTKGDPSNLSPAPDEEPKIVKVPATTHKKSQQQPQHRLPTIDEDALLDGGAAGASAGVDQSPNNNAESATNNNGSDDMLEEQQYMQNFDNIMGNINNTESFKLSGTPQQQQQQLQQQQQQQQQQPSDAEILIPTSNLQKFIESADKILKNMTTSGSSSNNNNNSSPQAATSMNDQRTDKSEKMLNDQPSPPEDIPSNAIDNNDDSNDSAAVMKVEEKIPSAVVAEEPAAAAAPAPVPQLPPAPKVPIPLTPSVKSKKPNIVDPSKGIPTENLYENGHMDNEIDAERICPHQGEFTKLLILITSAQSHAEARMAIRQTWGHYGSRRDISTAFVLGRSTNETLNKMLTQENYIYGDLIRGSFIDSYNNLTLKTLSSLEWIDLHCSRAKYILKTDDDMFINVPKLMTFLDRHKDKRVIYGRLAKKWKPIRNKKSKYYVSTDQFSATVFPAFTTGPAYVMTSDIVHELYKSSLSTVYLKLEDVFTTGIVAQKLGIRRVHANEFLNRRISFNPCNIRNAISVHMIKSNEQFDLWKKLLDQTTKCK